MQDPVFEEAYQGHTIKIYHDTDAESPREWCNLGTLICWHRRYRLGDSHQFDSPEAFLRDLAGLSDQSDLSIDLLLERAARKAVILPVFLYDHSGLAMNTIGFHCPWDSGQVGFVYVTYIQRVYGSYTPWPATFVSESGQKIAYPNSGGLGHFYSRSIMVEYGDYEGNMGNSEWFSY